MEQNELAEQLRKDYQAVFSSEAGARVLEDLRKTCFYYESTLHKDPHVMAYAEGQRNVILHIDTKIKLTAEKLKELQNARG